MSRKTKSLLAAIVLLLLGLAVWRCRGADRSPAPPDPGPGAEAAGEVPPVPESEPAAPAAEAPPGQAESAGEEPVPGGTMRGKVELVDAGPARGAKISVSRYSQREDHESIRMFSDSIETDASGRFELRQLPAGRYRFTVTFEGYASQERTVEVREDQGAALDFVLTRGGTLIARVLLPDGKPSRGRTVDVYVGSEPLPRHIVTDDEGTARFENLEPGSYRVETYGMGARHVMVPAVGTVETTFRLPEGFATLKGEILLPDRCATGKRRGSVRLAPIRASEGVGWEHRYTDAEGAYLFFRLHPGTYRVRGSVYVGLGSAAVVDAGEVTVAAGEERTFDLVVRDTELAGRVFRSDGQPVGLNHIGVWLKRAEGGDRSVSAAYVTTDEFGAFRIYGLEPGAYDLTARPRSGRTLSVEERRIELPPGGHLTDVEIVLGERALGRVRVRLSDSEGRPVNGARVDVESSEEKGSRPAKIRSRSRVGPGVTELHMETGRHVLRVALAGYRVEPREFPVEVVADGKLERNVTCTPIGYVRLRLTGTFEPATSKIEFTAERDGRPDPHVGVVAVRGEPGTFRLLVDVGPVTVRVKDRGREAGIVKLEVPRIGTLERTLELR